MLYGISDSIAIVLPNALLNSSRDDANILASFVSNSPHTKHDELSNGRAAGPSQNNFALPSGQSTLRAEFFGSAGAAYGADQPGRTASRSEQAIDPELVKPDPATQPGYAEALKLWARFRFVRAGWFTAQEAIEYID